MLKKFIPAIMIITATTAAHAKCQPTNIETDINAIRLDDGKRTEQVLGKISVLPIGANSEMELILFNMNKTEQAALSYHSGGSPGDFEEISVRRPPDSKLVGKTLDAPYFFTERGIRLGVSPNFVTSLLGKCYSKSISKSGEMTIEYWIEDINLGHLFLKRANIPTYYDRYHFRAEKLEAFEIGSEEP